MSAGAGGKIHTASEQRNPGNGDVILRGFSLPSARLPSSAETLTQPPQQVTVKSMLFVIKRQEERFPCRRMLSVQTPVPAPDGTLANLV